MESLKFTIRIDDIPDHPDPTESKNLAAVLEKHRAPATVAICSGWLRDWPAHQPIYRKLYDEGLLDIACHGMYHEDFGDVGEVGMYGEKLHYFRPLTLADTDLVLKECQAFARSFFGKEYTMFVTPGSNVAEDLLPKDVFTFYQILHINGFRSVSHYPGPSGADPLIKAFKRTEHIFEVPFTIYVDFWRRGHFVNNFVPEDYEKYVEATKDHIKTRYKFGLYVNLFIHLFNFRNDPDPRAGFQGNNPGGKFLDEILTWTKENYPGVEFVGMEDLIGPDKQ